MSFYSWLVYFGLAREFNAVPEACPPRINKCYQEFINLAHEPEPDLDNTVHIWLQSKTGPSGIALDFKNDLDDGYTVSGRSISRLGRTLVIYLTLEHKLRDIDIEYMSAAPKHRQILITDKNDGDVLDLQYKPTWSC